LFIHLFFSFFSPLSFRFPFSFFFSSLSPPTSFYHFSFLFFFSTLFLPSCVLLKIFRILSIRPSISARERVFGGEGVVSAGGFDFFFPQTAL
jgi:hypothetical protein